MLLLNNKDQWSPGSVGNAGSAVLRALCALCGEEPLTFVKALGWRRIAGIRPRVLELDAGRGLPHDIRLPRSLPRAAKLENRCAVTIRSYA